jgi:hypothetical protein
VFIIVAIVSAEDVELGCKNGWKAVQLFVYRFTSDWDARGFTGPLRVHVHDSASSHVSGIVT